MHVHISRHRNHGYVPADDCLCFALICLCMMVYMWLMCECGVFCFGNSSVYLGIKDFTGWMDKSFRAMVKVIYILYMYICMRYISGVTSPFLRYVYGDSRGNSRQGLLCMYVYIYMYIYIYIYIKNSIF